MILAIIQARMGSSRLPGKVLLDLAGRPVLWHGYTRASQAGRLDRVMVATTDAPGDEPIRAFCRQQGIICFGGSENDVLDRYVQAALSAGAKDGDGIARITADCPLIDPAVIDAVIKEYLESGADYASNVQPPTFPDGLDVEVFSFSALQKAWREARLPSEREHVTPYLRNHPERFTQRNVKNSQDLSALRWTLDEPADYALLQKVVAALYEQKANFYMTDVLQLMSDHPEWQEINQGFVRNEGYLKSLGQEQASLCLGTVQFGTDYGVNNRTGQPKQNQVFAILDRALAAGINWLDTAAAYGEAETVLGSYIRSSQAADRLRVVSKLRPDFFDNISRKSLCVHQALAEELKYSLQRLGLEKLDGYLLHSADRSQLEHGELGEAMEFVRASGLTRQVGASVYTSEQAVAALKTPWLDAVQVPYNILDRRLDRCGFFSAKAGLNRPVTVYARSLLLQGLLMMTEADIPIHLGCIAPHLKELDAWLAGHGFGRFDAAFWFVARRPGVDAAVVGVETLDQLERYIELSSRSVDFTAALKEGLERFQTVDDRLLSPNLWEDLRKEVKQP